MKEVVLFQNDFVQKESTFDLEEVTVPALQYQTVFFELNSQKKSQNNLRIQKINLTAREGSDLEYVFFQNQPGSQESFSFVEIKAEANARVRFTFIQNGSSKSQIDIQAHALGANAEIEIRGLHYAQGQQKLMTEVHTIHDVPHAKSTVTLWCVAKDQSQSIFKGLVTIPPGSHHSEAFQKNKNLILSSKAVVNSFPKLFIANDDVKCAHGSSTSTLDPDQVLYLQSRGIDLAASEKMMVQGFITQALDWLTDADMKNYILKEMDAVLEQEPHLESEA